MAPAFRAIIPAALSILLCTVGVSAAPQQLDCVLTDTDGQPQSENRHMTVEFDQETKRLIAREGSQQYSFEKVSISNVAMSGAIASLSIGIDRSSLGIVWQQYDADKVRTEFGHCRPAVTPQ